MSFTKTFSTGLTGAIGALPGGGLVTQVAGLLSAMQPRNGNPIDMGKVAGAMKGYAANQAAGMDKKTALAASLAQAGVPVSAGAVETLAKAGLDAGALYASAGGLNPAQGGVPSLQTKQTLQGGTDTGIIDQVKALPLVAKIVLGVSVAGTLFFLIKKFILRR